MVHDYGADCNQCGGNGFLTDAERKVKPGCPISVEFVLPPGPAAFHHILAIDPGSLDLGVAVYENGVLLHAELIEAPDIHGICPLCTMPCSHTSDPDLVTWYAERIKQVVTKYGISLIVSEMPVVFAKSGGGSQLLLIGAILGAVNHSSVVPNYWFKPSEWKGNKKKREHQLANLPLLSLPERALLPKKHKRDKTTPYATDPLDAALLGLWWLTMTKQRMMTYARLQPGECVE